MPSAASVLTPLLGAHPAAPTPLATPAPPAGGAPGDQILVMALFTSLVYGALAWVVLRERLGHATLLGRLAAAVGRLDRSPTWFALPLATVVLGVVSGVVGLYWDVSYHLAFGRDEGPLANPAHYFIYLGLVAIFAGAALGAGLADRPVERAPSRSGLPRRSFRLLDDWRTPYGPLTGMAVGMLALLGFPLDDVWHRLFGQDVTEWGPTHVLMIGGTVLSGYTILLTCAEAAQVARSRVRPVLEMVGLLIIPAGPVAFMLEYAFGIPQFPLLNDPLILAATASLAFVLASVRRWWLPMALWVAYAALEFGLLGLNVAVLDALPPWPPLLLGGALAATLVALVTRGVRPTVAYGAAAGAVVALAQTTVELMWTDATRPMAWPTDMLPLAFAGSAVVGAAAGVVAVWLQSTLARVAARDDDPAPDGRQRGAPAAAGADRRVGGRLAALGVVVVVAVLAVTVPPRAGELGEGGDRAMTATVRVVDAREGADDSGGGHGLEGVVELTVSDPGTAREAWWFETLSWQGGGAVRGRLVPVDHDTWRTTGPVPLHGTWKTLVRLHEGPATLVALPIYLPADPAIPAPAVTPPVGAAETRAFVPESEILRREEKQGVPAWLWGTAYVVVGALFAALLVVLGAGLCAAARREGQAGATPTRTPVRAGA